MIPGTSKILSKSGLQHLLTITKMLQKIQEKLWNHPGNILSMSIWDIKNFENFRNLYVLCTRFFRFRFFVFVDVEVSRWAPGCLWCSSEFAWGMGMERFLVCWSSRIAVAGMDFAATHVVFPSRQFSQCRLSCIYLSFLTSLYINSWLEGVQCLTRRLTVFLPTSFL